MQLLIKISIGLQLTYNAPEELRVIHKQQFIKAELHL